MHTPHVDSPPRPSDHRPATLSAGTLALCSALLLALVAVGWRPLLDLDGDISRTTHRWAVEEPGLTQTARVLTDWVWDPWTMRVLCGVTAALLVWRYAARWTAMWLVVTVALGTAVQQGLKAAVDRARPVWPDPVDSAHYAAFPSGHAMTATVVCGLLLWLLRRHGVSRLVWRTALVLAVLSVTGVGLTRVWLGVHWPTDVLGGWLLGALVVAVAVRIHRRRHP
ncbi:phosphatase PAP2 family protein [Streptomyces griseomycini]|uniref:Undecaprenyl-diphosphatase n=1 Tax=Streptomyces griseomycini TaxID=66895 RepID=A0A7W7M195_9ACTN|nr:phosphatase PAP2 family protein [Streptomyces griseomycini]MBB4899797.1 undecaprenyl-diphosphatase [Streptomyces griseomycini]GGP96908.1 phosphatase PAP2 family protein [Streptomyces griseomycini]GGR06654.1 phosphatase PAP2 family protein [Streptomyces griseomycini]